MSHKPRILNLFAFALVLAFSQGSAQAQVVKPFKITGGGPAPHGISLIPGVPAMHYATGQATELGRYSCEGLFTLLTPPSFQTLTATFSTAPPLYCRFTAANGDILTCTYGDTTNHAAEPGMVTLTPVGQNSFTARFVAEFNPVPGLCSGRFANVIGGSFLMIAKSTPFSLPTGMGTNTTAFTYTWDGEGSLTFTGGN
jgi:hypothetical protein